MNTLDAILTRRSCREFTDKPIKSETLHQLLEAAMSGPSCVNAQDWSFVVVTDPEKLAQMADANGHPAEPLRKAAAGILVCGDLDRAFRFAKDYWVIDGAIAAQNICLAAQELGLGAVWLGTWPQMDRVEAQQKLFALPETIVPHSIIALGYPEADLTAPRKSRYEDDRVHFNQWSIFQTKPRAFLLDTLPYCSSFIQVEQTVQSRLSSAFSFFSIITQTTSWLQR